jgi:hypothetical protein
MVIVEVLGLRVSPVVVAVFHAVAPEPEIVQVPLPMLKVRVLLLFEEKKPVVTLKFAVVNVPALAVVPPITTLLSVPPVIVTALAFWVDIVPKPVILPAGIVSQTGAPDIDPLPV